MLRTPRGHLLLIALLVLTLISGYAVRKAESERPPSLRDFSRPYLGQLLEPRPDWGEPPDEDYLREHLTEKGTTGFRLPELAGWYRFLGYSSGFHYGPDLNLVAGQNVVVYARDGSFHCIELETGEQRWEIPVPDQPWSEMPATPFVLISPGAFLVFGADTLTAYSLNNGSKLWECQQSVPIAWGKGIIWALRYGDDRDSNYQPSPKRIVVIDAVDGHIRREFALSTLISCTSTSYLDYGILNGFTSGGTVSGVFPDEEGRTERIAVKDGKKIKVYSSDGTVIQFPAALSIWPASMVFTEEGLLVVEYESMLTDSLPYSALDRLRNKPYSVMVARLLDLSSKKELWRLSERDESKEAWVTNYSALAMKDVALICKEKSTRVLDLNTCKVISEIPVRVNEYLPVLALGSSGKYFITPQSNGIDSLCLYDLPSGKKASPYLIGTSDDSLCIYKDTLIAGTISYPAGEDYFGGNLHLFAIKLDDSGKPVEGKLATFDMPSNRTELVGDFYYNPNPIEDPGLMRRALAGGLDAVAALAEHAARAKPRQLDALMALTGYLYQDYEAPSSMDVFEHYIRSADNEMLARRAILWHQDKSLEPLNQALRFFLAGCGGESAKAYLDTTYRQRKDTGLNIPKPPYSIPEDIQPPTDKEHNSYSYRTWGAYKSDKGVTYIAYTYEGLISYRQIFIGVDGNSDDKFEEVLPTGLLDVTNYAISITKGKGFKMMSVRVDGDDVQLGYNAPAGEILKTPNESQGDVYYLNDKTVYKTAKLSLKALRKDSDSDGLTDIAEKLLFINPNSKDTDGDGLKDFTDPSPNASNQSVREVERGVQRALEFVQDKIVSSASSATLKGKELPFRTLYISFEGCAGVPIYIDQLSRCICLTTRQERNVYNDLERETSLFSMIDVRVYTIEQWQAPQPLSPVKASHLSMISGRYERKPPAGTKYVVTIEGLGSDLMMPLGEIEGELYPIGKVDEDWRGIIM
jgi:hypothetical protein